MARDLSTHGRSHGATLTDAPARSRPDREAPREHTYRRSAAATHAQPVVPEDDGPILEVEDLNVSFYVDGEWFPAAIDVSYHVDAGEVLAIVGESGSGKTQSSMSLLGLLPVERARHAAAPSSRARSWSA